MEKFFAVNFGREFLEGREAKIGGSEEGSNKDDDEDKMEEEEGNGVYDNL